jgi:hypothetical protein
MTGNSSSVVATTSSKDQSPKTLRPGHQLVRVSLLAVEHVGVRLEGREAAVLAHHPAHRPYSSHRASSLSRSSAVK